MRLIMLEKLVEKLPALQNTGYLLIFVAAILESLPAIGLLVPGQTILVLGGFLSSSGVMHWWLVALIATAGAIIGDSLAYWLGRRYKLKFLGKHEQMLSDVVSLLHSHPFKTLVLGRFNSLTRSFAPYAAGASQVSVRKFMIANIVGGALWAFTWTGVGILLGAGFGYVSNILETTVLVAVVLAAGLFFLFRYLRRKYGLGHVAFVLATLSALTIIAFAMLVSGLNSPYVQSIDTLGQTITLPLSATILTAAALVLTSLIHPLTLSFIIVVFSTGLMLVRRREAAGLFIVAVGGAIIIAFMVKSIVLRVRPPSAMLWNATIGSNGFGSWSFPSGHALIAVTVFGSIALTVRRFASKHFMLTSTCLVLAIGVSLSRVLLGVHWLSDVLAGATLGLFWISLVYLINEAARARGAAVRAGKRVNPRKKEISAR